MARYLIKYHLKSLEQHLETLFPKNLEHSHVNKFAEIKTNLERVNFILQELFESETSLPLLEQEEQNSYSEKGMQTLAVESYTKCIAQAESKGVLALSYADRSAVLFKMELFKECIQDINRALANNYPDDLRPELIERKRAALKRISFIETAASHKEIPHVSNKTPSGIQCASSSSEIHQPSNMQNIDSFRGSASWIESSNGLDYGSGMAHSFFYGYLKLVISETDTTNNHLKNLMKIYEANNNVKFECYKMFILIPKSLHCPMSLKNKNNPSIEESRSLPEKVFTVAGVKDRVYKNSVYKIKTASRKMVYVVAEYATPLKTFHDVIISNAIHSKVYEKYKDAIVLQFYRTLKQIVEDNESCTNHCQLIFYDDKDDEGKYYDVGQILLDQLMTPKRTRTH